MAKVLCDCQEVGTLGENKAEGWGSPVTLRVGGPYPKTLGESEPFLGVLSWQEEDRGWGHRLLTSP